MTLAIIDIFIRSASPVEVSPGVYEYTHERISGVPATLTKNQNANFNNAQSINVKTRLNSSFSILFANDATNRFERITHLLYGSTLYDVGTVTPYPPRVVIDLGDVSSNTIKDLVQEVEHDDED